MNLYALQVMLQIIPVLNNSLASVINMAVGNVSPNLSSKNREINQTAVDIIDSLLENLGKFLWSTKYYLKSVLPLSIYLLICPTPLGVLWASNNVYVVFLERQLSLLKHIVLN